MTPDPKALVEAREALTNYVKAADRCGDTSRHAAAIRLLLAAPAPPPKDGPAEGMVWAISVEKLLLEKLGREWTPAGISIVSLIDELAARSQPVQARGGEQALRQALRNLTFMARTSGGTAGADLGLMAACEEAEACLAALPVQGVGSAK